MRIIVDKMPETCSGCLFSKRGAHLEEDEYKCFCSLLKTERTIYEFETMKDCPLIDFRTAKNLGVKIPEIY